MRWIAPLVLVVGVSVLCGEAVAADLQPLLADLDIVPLGRQTAPPFALRGLDGARLALSDLRGRPALLYFWATW